MGSLKYLGKPVAADADLVYQSYVANLKGGDLSADAIDQAINSGLGGYATIDYVNTRDGLLATQSYIDNQDNLRLKLSARNLANGWAGLDATGKVRNQLINLPADQKYHRGPWSPTSYGANTAVTEEATLFTVGVTDPGFPYKLIVWGNLDQHTNQDSEYGVIRVRQGDAVGGQIIAQGFGSSDANDFFGLGDDFNRANISGNAAVASGFPLWAITYFNDNGNSGSIGIRSNQAAWYDDGVSTRRVQLQMTNSVLRHTPNDYPRIYIDVGTNTGEADTHVRVFGRANDAFNTWVVLEQTLNKARFLYSINGADSVAMPYFDSTLTANTPFFMQCGTPSQPRRFSWWKGGLTPVQQGFWDDTSAVTPQGPNYRGWGFGMRSTQRSLGQATPPSLDAVYFGDALAAFEPTVITPTDMTAITGPTTLYVRGLRSGTTSTQSYQNYRPKLHVLAIPA